MFRSKKNGVLGTMNCGKTILLTSLLWHLKEYSPDLFHIGKRTNAEVKDVNLDENGSRAFPYKEYIKMLVTEGGWPDKTKDFSIARCTYARTDSYWERDVTFVDIPGERVSDVFIWQADNYADWTNRIKRFWAGDADMEACMENFEKSLHDAEHKQDKQDVQDQWETLVKEYKRGLIALAGISSPFITPSTFVLTTDGKIIERGTSNEEIEKRPIWNEGDFFPVPEKWKKSRNKTLKTIFKNCEKNFDNYRRKVLKPLYREIDDCNSFIVCVDIFNILVSGLSRFYQVKGEISNFFQMIRPSKFGEVLINMQKVMDALKINVLLPKFMQAKPPKIAYVATKSDMAIRSVCKNRLQKLLQELVRSVNNSSYVNSKLFTCCAGKTFELDSDANHIVFFSDKGEVHVPIEKWPELPTSWEKWDTNRYRTFLRKGRPLQIEAGSPPKQDNIDKLFDFITEDDD